MVGTAFAETAALPFYYPYDLIKVRMQTMQAKYGYINFTDGMIKIWQEKKEQKPSRTAFVKNTAEMLSRVTPNILSSQNERKERIKNYLLAILRIRNYYSGALWYGMAYTMYISLQFGIHDMMVQWIGDFTGSRQTSLFKFL